MIPVTIFQARERTDMSEGAGGIFLPAMKSIQDGAPSTIPAVILFLYDIHFRTEHREMINSYFTRTA